MIIGNEMKAFYHIFLSRMNAEGGLAARTQDVNETRLNDNFKTILDEFRKVWSALKNGFETKSISVREDAIVNGTLDVRATRYSKTLSSIGWYRVASCSMSGSSVGVSVGVGSEQAIDAEVLLASSSVVQVSLKNTQTSNAISDIRVMLGGGSFHIDIKKANNASVSVSVDLTPHGNARNPGNLTAASLTPVDDNPSGETALASISTAKKTVPLSSPTALITNGTIVNSATFSYTATRPCWFYYTPVLQAGTSGGFEISLNGVVLASYTSGEAIGVNVAAIPVPMQTGDVLDISQNSNRTSSYRVLTMRGAS